MAYDSDDIAEKLRSLKGSDYEEFDQEDLDKMFRSSMVEPKKVSDGWTKDQRNSYRLMYGQDELDKADNEVDYSKYGNLDKPRGTGAEMRMLFGDGGVDNFRTGKLTEEQEMWDAARERAGIKKVNSMSDIAEIRDKVNREMMGRMTGLGMSAMAKDEEIAEPATTTEDKPVTSDTLIAANKKTKEYEEEIRPSLGDSMFGDFEPPKMEGGPKDINSKTGRPNDKTYLDEYKVNIADKMTPIKPDGTRSQSKYAKMREDRRRQRKENRRKQTNRQLA